MPRRNTKARPHRGGTLRVLPDPTPAESDPTPGPVPATGGTPRVTAEDKLRDALRAHPGATRSELAGHAGIGHSTAARILTNWEQSGTALRTPAPTRRGPDIWTAVTGQPADAGDEQPPADAATATRGSDATSGDQDNPGNRPSGDRADAAAEHPGQDSTATPSTDESGTAQGRLGKGALRGLVEDYLTEHPGEQFSPSAIGKALSRSSGAVANALERLVADGYATQTQDKPKRYSASTPSEATTT